MGEKTIIRYENRTAILTLNNPPVNVLTDELRDEIREAFIQFSLDANVKSVIVTGNGEKAFMAGANIRNFPSMVHQNGAAYGYAKTIYDVWEMIEQFPKPVIAAINGLALGAGMELALVCDIRIAEEHGLAGKRKENNR